MTAAPQRETKASAAPLRKVQLGNFDAVLEQGAGGVIHLRTEQVLPPYYATLSEPLDHWAKAAPERVFLAGRDPQGEWRRLTYAQVLSEVKRIGAALLRRGLSAERPIAILSGNDVEHALLALAAMYVGIPYAPISPAYSLMSTDFGKLRAMFGLLTPGLVFAADGISFARALYATVPDEIELVVTRNPLGDRKCTLFADLAAEDEANVAAARNNVRPDSVAKFLFTSGSTGSPKAVINTQRMLCSNQQTIVQVWPFIEETPPVVVDWLPWNHTFGANHNFNMVLRNGGTLYIDDGKPMPGLVDKTAANLREIAPTIYFNVPRGYDMLLPFLEQDEQLRRNFFSRLQLIFYAAAALPQNLWERLERLSMQERGERVVMVSSWGATETAPMVTAVHFPIERAGVIGLPTPGTELKMLPNGDKLELRVRGPNVTPGYWKRDDLTKAAFDAEGFYMIGDAGRFADAADPARGLEFDGRIAEDFKLTSGTWVHVGGLRVKGIAALAPVAQDIVVTGHDRKDVGFLVFPSVPACRALCPDLAAEAKLAEVFGDSRVQSSVREGLLGLARAGSGTSTFAARALLMEEPPSIDAGEITDKGYINQRAVLARRRALVEKLYAEIPGPDVIPLPWDSDS